MGGQVINLLVIVAVGVIIAELVTKSTGTANLFGGLANIWAIGVNGMLGNATNPQTGATTPVQGG